LRHSWKVCAPAVRARTVNRPVISCFFMLLFYWFCANIVKIIVTDGT
jgi:hypothetical protein